MSGGDFALGMADDRVRVNAEGIPQSGEGNHHREQHGLDDVDALQGRCVRSAVKHVIQRPFDMRRQGFGAGTDVFSENGGFAEEGQGHPVPLRALAGKDENRFSRTSRDSCHQARRRVPTAQRRQPVQEFLAVTTDERCPVGERCPGRCQRKSHVRRVEIRPGGDDLVQCIGLGVQPAFVFRRYHPWDHRRVNRDRVSGDFGVPGHLIGNGRLRDDEMAVGSPHPEGTDSGDERSVRSRPVSQISLDPKVDLVEADLGIRCLEVQARWNLPMSDAKRRLEKADDSGSSLQMAHVRLGRTHQQGVSGGSGRAERRAERGGLDRVADLRPGAVKFHVLDVTDVHAGLLDGQPQDLFLSLRVRDGEAVGGTVVVDGAAADYAVDIVAVGESPHQRLEYDYAATLTAHVAVGTGVERVGAAVRRQPTEPCGRDGAFGNYVQVHATGQRENGLSLPHALVGQVNGYQCGRLRRVHRQAGSAQTERVGHPVRDDAPVEPCQGMTCDRLVTPLVEQRRVVARDGTDKDTGTNSGEARGNDSRVFDGLPPEFQDQPLLRIHVHRFAG